MAIFLGAACGCNIPPKQEYQAFSIDVVLAGLALAIILGFSRQIALGRIAPHTIPTVEMVMKIAKITLIIQMILIAFVGCCCCMVKVAQPRRTQLPI